MSEIVAKPYILTDSMFKSRPTTDIFYKTDANGGLNDLRRFYFEKNRSLARSRCTQKNFEVKPISKIGEVEEIKQLETDITNKVASPFRDYDTLVDPISGFLSAGTDRNRQLGLTHIRSYTTYNDGPQYQNPQTIHSIRKDLPTAFPETNRLLEREPPGLEFHAKHLSAGCVRAQLGGWTSTTDKTPGSAKLTLLCHLPKAKTDLSESDRLAYKYIYTSTTQAGYEAVDFDKRYGGKKHFPPTTAFERCADPVGQCNNAKQRQVLNAWNADNQTQGISFGSPHDNYNTKLRPYSFCSPNRRSRQIPGYSGCIGATNFDDIDNLSEAYVPFTLKRNPIPKFACSGAPRDIPGYTGHRRYDLPSRNVKSAPAYRQSVTTGTHQAMPIDIDNSDCKREARVSKTVTIVAPNNPFNKV